MKNVALLAGASAILAALSVPAFAQTEIATGANATGISAVDDQITDVEDAVQDDFDRQVDADRFGPAERRQGLFGSMALTYSGTTGSNRLDNDGQQDLAVAGRVSYNRGVFSQSVGLLMEYSEDEADGSNDKKEVTAIYDAQYSFNDRFYGFGLGRIMVDGEADAGELDRDGFLGFGPGYRVINTADTAWRVQAGVGVAYSRVTDGDSETDVGYIASSRFYHRISDTMFITNDTDYLTSDARDIATNSLGVGFKMSDALATKISYDTEYENVKYGGVEGSSTENTVGLSIVYGF